MHARKGYISIALVAALLVLGSVFYASSPNRERVDVPPTNEEGALAEEALYEGEYVVVNLNEMNIYLKQGATTLEVLPIISIGKPGSYYETIGGAHTGDYKIQKHFSSIGHVYMPWSTHVFGNFFIHGIPYYPDGRKVSSEYSGGCVRLTDEDARKVYDFVEKGTPIIVTSGSEKEFIPTRTTTQTIMSQEITRYMVAVISLEVLTQDSPITDTDNRTQTTRRKLLPRLIAGGDDEVSKKLAEGRGEQTFIEYMNLKAQALGMSSTHFSSLTEPVATTLEDVERFRGYLTEYKTYLVSLSTSTPTFSQ